MNSYHGEDLTYHSRGHCENALNVGWAVDDNCATAEKTRVSNDFIERLAMFLDRKFTVNKIRETYGSEDWFEFGEIRVRLGVAQIRILSADFTKRYAAPDSIIKYIKDENYSPPDEFVDAVINGPAPLSAEYQHYMNRFSQKFLWGEDAEYIARSHELAAFLVDNNKRRLEATFSEKPSDINILTRHGSLLNLAIKQRNFCMTEFLIEAGLDINRFNGFELLTALAHNELEVAEMLLSNSIKYNQKAKRCDPVFYAVHYKNNDALRLLKKHGINPVAEYL